MPSRDPRVDAYIEKSAPFARPILRHLRATVHTACPDVEETIKWGMPNFMYQGMLCSAAAFKEHATFGFWKGKLVIPPGASKSADAMGQFGKITSVADLPPKSVIVRYVKAAMKLNEAGVTVKRAPAKKKPPLVMPADLKAALAKNAKARKTYEALAPSKQREYVEWLTEAKTEPTRLKRLKTAVEWMAEGKSRYWKYANC